MFFKSENFKETQFLFFRDNNKIEGRSKASEISSAAAQARRIIAGHFNRRLFHSSSFQTFPAASDVQCPGQETKEIRATCFQIRKFKKTQFLLFRNDDGKKENERR